LKLAALLAEYLYQQKKLDLAGIGTFSINPSRQINSDAQHPSAGISFEHNASVKDDDELIGYISAQTGKMKTLASSDLSSYIELGLQFLHIGKPLQIEGIGTLVKTKDGGLDFTADHLIVSKVKETGIKELSATSISDELLTTYETLKPKEENFHLQKILPCISCCGYNCHHHMDKLQIKSTQFFNGDGTGNESGHNRYLKQCGFCRYDNNC